MMIITTRLSEATGAEQDNYSVVSLCLVIKEEDFQFVLRYQHELHERGQCNTNISASNSNQQERNENLPMAMI